ncbi:ATP-dependent DNA helicase PIF1-like [Mercenaria mercenaria]|uniref:ATP-dependent DNA helicase PIF1-like n=1 Tax=Mercenaria mercenaria TaxID=6596 RepID=UPI00234ECA81|nr:ATP-dependent DNA helicase PIF1-like [Mercenaria mercenaria]
MGLCGEGHVVERDSRFKVFALKNRQPGRIRSRFRTLQCIVSADVLIIDEISMLSAKLFEQLGAICSIKDPSRLFGGIQIIVSGDFFQLAPVPNKEYKDEGAMCFTSPLFEKVLPHKVVLTEVVRQDNECFIKAIHEVSKGTVSPETISFIKKLERPFPVGPDSSVVLFANNDLVNIYNRREILKCPGQIREFVSEDSGDIRVLIKSNAPPRLWLKEGCPVILIRNLSKTLVNGLQGKVVDFEEGCPVVHFPSISCTTKLEKVSFTVFNPDKNMTIATRVQVPLKLAYAITIHKAQGMTLDR